MTPKQEAKVREALAAEARQPIGRIARDVGVSAQDVLRLRRDKPIKSRKGKP